MSIPLVILPFAGRTYTFKVHQNPVFQPRGLKLDTKPASLILRPQWIMHMLLQTAAQQMWRPKT